MGHVLCLAGEMIVGGEGSGDKGDSYHYYDSLHHSSSCQTSLLLTL